MQKICEKSRIFCIFLYILSIDAPARGLPLRAELFIYWQFAQFLVWNFMQIYYCIYPKMWYYNYIRKRGNRNE